MSAEFYLKDVNHKQLDPEKTWTTSEIFFKFVQPQHSGACDFESDNKASIDNTKHYPVEWKEFVAANPSAVADEKLNRVFLDPNYVAPEPAVEAPAVDEAAVAEENKQASEVDV